jgi:CRP/FNR family cyclic AMP-dependent transcriptional regulator
MDKQDAALVKSISSVPLFAGCSRKQLKIVAASGKLLVRKEGATIVEEGASGVAFFVLLSGSADVVKDGDLVARLMPGEFFGEMSLMLDETRNAEVVAAADSELFAFTRWAFRSLVKTNPGISLVIMKTLAARQSAQ